MDYATALVFFGTYVLGIGAWAVYTLAKLKGEQQ